MKGVAALVCCALFVLTFIVFSNGQTTQPTVPAPTTKAPATTPTKPGTGKPNQTSPDTLQCDVYNLTLKLPNATFEENLLNPHSAEFNKLRSDFEVGIMQVYDGYKPFTGVTTLRFSKAPDGKTIVHFCIEFKDNGTHLPNLTAALKAGKLGKLTPLSVAPKLGQAACFQAPPPPVCQAPCPSTCAPNCYETCCQGGYQQTYYVPAAPPPPMPVPIPTPSACPNACPSTCLPVGCSPACCNTIYNQAQYPYGKRHHAPKPLKGMKKHRIFGKQHRKH